MYVKFQLTSVTVWNTFLQRCPDDEMVVVDFEKDAWSCEPRSEHNCPPGGFHVCPFDGTTDLTPPTEVTGNPLGVCRCDGEIWLSEGCSYGFYCNSSIEDIGGEYLYCDEEVILHPTILNDTFKIFLSIGLHRGC